MTDTSHTHRVDVACIDCVQEKSQKYELLLNFIKSIVCTNTFSTANYWYLHKQAKQLLEDIKEKV